MDIMLIIGVPFSVLFLIIGSLVCLEGRYWKVFTVALIAFILCVLDIYLLAQWPVEIQAKKYIIAMSIALTLYVIAFVFNLIQFLLACEYTKEAKSESECLQRMKAERGEK